MIPAILAVAAAISAVVEAILIIAAAAAVIDLLFDPKGKQRVAALLGNIVGGALDIAVPLLSDVEGLLTPVAQAFISSIDTHGGGLLNIVRDPASKLAQTILTDAATALAALGESTPDNAIAGAGVAIGHAFGDGIGSTAVTALFEATFPEKLNTLNAAGPLFAQMAGFEEVAKAAREPLYDAAFGKSLEYHYRSLFKPELPSEGDAIVWHARGLLTDDQLKKIFDFSGLKTEYEPAFITSAYRAVSPFVLVRAVETGILTRDDLDDVLKFGGYRPIDRERMVRAFIDSAVQTYRAQALSAFITAAERGLYSGDDIDAELKSLDVIDAAVPYIKKTIGYRRLEQLAELGRKSISEGYKYGQVSDAEYIPDIENFGINQDDAAAHYAVDSINRRGKEEQSAERAAAKLAAEQQRTSIQRLRQQYQDDIIGVVAFTAGIATLGLDPTLAANIIGIATARKEASQHFVFGVSVTKQQAILLREKVSAVGEQAIKKLITPDAAHQLLRGFGIPEDDAAALVAKWAAQADKQVLTP